LPVRAVVRHVGDEQGPSTPTRRDRCDADGLHADGKGPLVSQESKRGASHNSLLQAPTRSRCSTPSSFLPPLSSSWLPRHARPVDTFESEALMPLLLPSPKTTRMTSPFLLPCWNEMRHAS